MRDAEQNSQQPTWLRARLVRATRHLDAWSWTGLGMAYWLELSDPCSPASMQPQLSGPTPRYALALALAVGLGWAKTGKDGLPWLPWPPPFRRCELAGPCTVNKYRMPNVLYFYCMCVRASTHTYTQAIRASRRHGRASTRSAACSSAKLCSRLCHRIQNHPKLELVV
jgi:hypothetical protein